MSPLPVRHCASINRLLSFSVALYLDCRSSNTVSLAGKLADSNPPINNHQAAKRSSSVRRLFLFSFFFFLVGSLQTPFYLPCWYWLWVLLSLFLDLPPQCRPEAAPPHPTKHPQKRGTQSTLHFRNRVARAFDINVFPRTASISI